ncbi:MAG: hypothetical protein PVH88_12250 [Ignavibacteria bacterium]
MKNKTTSLAIIIAVQLFLLTNEVPAQLKPILKQTYTLSGERTKEPQCFILETILTNYNLNGTITGKDVLKLYLKCIPQESNGNNTYKYSCRKFSIKQGDSGEVTIPALENWSYLFGNNPNGYDEKGQVFGIDHAKFEKLTDNLGNPVSQNMSYWVYNSFIDFHGFCNVFAEPVTGGKGIQNLKEINQKIIHASANTEAPVNLGSNVSEGSYFKNGEITLAFTGISLVNDAACAIINFDSGESSFKMKMTVAPGMDITTTGSSHYKGNIYINTNTFWVEKVVMDEFVLSETTVPGQPDKINSVTGRNTIIYNVDGKEFL